MCTDRHGSSENGRAQGRKIINVQIVAYGGAIALDGKGFTSNDFPKPVGTIPKPARSV